MGVCQTKIQEPGQTAQATEKALSKSNRQNIYIQEDKLKSNPGIQFQEAQLSHDSLQKLLQIAKKHPQIVKQLQANLSHLKETSVFKVSQIQTSTKIVHLGNGYWHNFIKAGKISKNSAASYKIRLNKTLNQDVIVGIATEDIFGKANSHTSKQCLAYRTFGSGYLYKNGKNNSCTKGIKEGETIVVDVDLTLQKISWKVGDQKITEAVIPAVMKAKDIYLVIMMYWQKDQVELFK